MELRVKKQIIIGSIFFLVILIIAFGVYFFYLRPAPACNDRIKNQGEEGIDCGGPCAQFCEDASLKDVDIQWVKALPTENHYYDLVARIFNLNQNYGSREIKYEFKLYDINDKEIASKPGSTFILPRQDKYIIELRVPTAQNVARVRLNISPVKWEKISDYIQPAVNIFDKKYQPLDNGPPYSQASCVVKNTSQFDYKNIKLDFVLFNADGEPIGINSSEIDVLTTGQERLFSVPWHFKINGNVVRIEVETEVNVFD